MMNVMYVKCMVHPKILCLNYHRPSTVEQIERRALNLDCYAFQINSSHQSM
jgi:hypothetical protein